MPSIEASDTNTGEEAKVRRRGGTLARQVSVFQLETERMRDCKLFWG